MITGRCRDIVKMSSVPLLLAYRSRYSHQHDKQPLKHITLLLSELRRGLLGRPKSGKCFRLCSLNRYPALQSRVYGVGKVLTGLLNDPTVNDAALPQFAAKLGQICLKRG